jgi:Ca2+-transporting ATPase
MLTGDQAATAYEIGKSLGLNNGSDLLIINSDELERMAPAQLNEMAGQAHIFSRVTPADKLRIVQAIQGSGAVVARTGDGTNDSPALRAADVGIAMGSGTDAALSVADVALKYDQLDSLLDRRSGWSGASGSRPLLGGTRRVTDISRVGSGRTRTSATGHARTLRT